MGAKLLRSLPALAIGAVGGALFFLMRMPLAWMLGSMCLVTLCALAGWPRRKPVKVALELRSLMIVVLGVMLGAAFTPDMLNRWRDWGLLMLVMLVYVPVAGGACYWLYRRLTGADPITAYFAAMPGGLAEMILMGEAQGGHVRSIVLAHVIRVFLVVMTVPLYFRFVAGYSVPSMPQGPSVQELPLTDGGVLLACGLLGWWLAQRLKIPAAHLIGPMVVSGAVHLAGLSTAKPPPEVIALAQVVVGAALGCRFVGTKPSEMGGPAAAAAATALLMLGIAIALSFGLSGPLALEPQALILVLAPGGLAEMSLVALALGVEVALVSSLHVFRIAAVVIGAPAVFRLAGLKKKA